GPADFAEIASRIDITHLKSWLRMHGLDAGTARRLSRELPTWIRHQSPRSEFATTFGDALEYLGDLADKRAGKPPRLAKPEGKRAAVQSLVFRLADLFDDILGTPLNAHVATLVSAAYRTKITEDDIKKLLRSRDRRATRALRQGGTSS